jgi:hypothetical protein
MERWILPVSSRMSVFHHEFALFVIPENDMRMFGIEYLEPIGDHVFEVDLLRERIAGFLAEARVSRWTPPEGWIRSSPENSTCSSIFAESSAFFFPWKS